MQIHTNAHEVIQIKTKYLSFQKNVRTFGQLGNEFLMLL